MKLNESHKVNGTINAVSRTQPEHNTPITRTKENDRHREIKRDRQRESETLNEAERFGVQIMERIKIDCMQCISERFFLSLLEDD